MALLLHEQILKNSGLKKNATCTHKMTSEVIGVSLFWYITQQFQTFSTSLVDTWIVVSVHNSPRLYLTVYSKTQKHLLTIELYTSLFQQQVSMFIQKLRLCSQCLHFMYWFGLNTVQDIYMYAGKVPTVLLTVMNHHQT